MGETSTCLRIKRRHFFAGQRPQFRKVRRKHLGKDHPNPWHTAQVRLLSSATRDSVALQWPQDLGSDLVLRVVHKGNPSMGR